jgi:hypothetical protein
MATQMQAMFAEQVRRRTEDAAQRPKELADLDARIERLRERQRTGDPDLATDELQSTIDRAMQKRSQLEAALPEAKRSAAVLAMLPKAAALYRQQIDLGLDGDPRCSESSRDSAAALRQIVLRPGPDRSLLAEFEVQPSALIREGTGCGAEGNRTLDLCIANASLSQLSYRPTARRAILAS